MAPDNLTLEERKAKRRAYLKDYAKKWKKRNPEKQKAIAKRANAKQKDRQTIRRREWRKNNPEKWKAANKKWNDANKDKLDAYRKTYQISWQRNNREKIKEYKRRHRLKEPERYRKQCKEGNARKLAKQTPEQREKQRAKMKARFAKNREQVKRDAREYYWRNVENLKVKKKAYAKSEHGQIVRRNLENKRRARKAQNGGTMTVAEWKQILEACSSKCYWCQREYKRLTQDHVVPISRGGRHEASNVVPSCKSCNSSKRDKTGDEFLAWRQMQGIDAATTISSNL